MTSATESFNPRTPCGVRLVSQRGSFGRAWFQSTHSLRSATSLNYGPQRINKVSIHALLAECDVSHETQINHTRSFNPRTPCGVRPSTPITATATEEVSIHALLAECDNRLVGSPTLAQGFNPRTPCGVRLHDGLPGRTFHGFNPRTPCGVRLLRGTRFVDGQRFQSTHSLRSATMRSMLGKKPDLVSIHALLAECDTDITPTAIPTDGFNPRTPCGVRQSAPAKWREKFKFQSTHSLRSATDAPYTEFGKSVVSIHALLAECDCA